VLNFIRNIFRISVIGFLFFGVSGFTLVIHHEHPSDAPAKKLTAHAHGENAEEHHQAEPSTIHEVHFVKLSSGDQFTISLVTELRFSVIMLFIIPTALSDSFPNLLTATVVHIADLGIRPSSGDKCALFSSFLI